MTDQDMLAFQDPPVSIKQPERPKLRDILGPGLITGASDDDPSGIATYSQAGAQFGYQFGWTLLFSWPLMCAVQEISARIGRVTGHGLAGVLARHAARPLVFVIVGVLLVANTINIGADLGAMGAALQLLIGGPSGLYVLGFAVVSVMLEVFLRYARYVSVLKWLSLSLFAYVAVALVVHVPWNTVGRQLVLPELRPGLASITAVVAILGTTISPYLFFWQAEEEVEDEKERPGAKPLLRAPEQAPREFGRIRLDTWLGMGLSNTVALFIMITAAATLNQHGITTIDTAAQAAEALRPVAGRFAFLIFALGIIGTGLLALPVLASSSAYALGEVLGFHVGLARRPRRAKVFYAIIAVSTAIGAGLNFSAIDPIKALVWSAVVNGLAAPPIMAVLVWLGSKPAVMGRFTLPASLTVIGWIATAVMTVAALALVASWFVPG